MRILVAGATGAIGRLLVPLLLADGHEVAGTSRSAEGVKAIDVLGAKGLQMDALSADSVNAALQAFRPEIVVHQLTALGERDFAANSRLRIEGTQHLVDAALEVGARKIVSQSISWVYEGGDTPADESVALDDTPERAGTMAGVRALESAPSREWLPALATAFAEPAPAIVPGRAAWERGASNHKAHTELGWTPEWPTWRTGFAAA